MERCDRCGREIPANNLVLTEQNGKMFGICGACQTLMGTCHTCVNKTVCEFETSPLQIPPVVMKEIRQGNAVIRQQIKNPDRIRETCQKGCKCFGEEFGCFRQINQTCGNYIEEELHETV